MLTCHVTLPDDLGRQEQSQSRAIIEVSPSKPREEGQEEHVLLEKDGDCYPINLSDHPPIRSTVNRILSISVCRYITNDFKVPDMLPTTVFLPTLKIVMKACCSGYLALDNSLHLILQFNTTYTLCAAPLTICKPHCTMVLASDIEHEFL